MFKILSIALSFANVYSQLVGGARDTNNCLIGAGYSWCESSQSCIRSWETPCKDHYTSCEDCLNQQRMGINIACPSNCNNLILPEPCPEVMCMIYCENGLIQDSNGCNTCQCNEPLIDVDPMYPVDPLPPVVYNPVPEPVIINPFGICSELQMAVYHQCDSDCQNCDLDNTRNILNECTYNNGVLVNTLCQGEMSSCDIPYEDCENKYVCPKITEVTSCGGNGLSGYSTYRLSLIIKNSNVKNIYAIYGSDENQEFRPMVLPPAYQSNVNFNSNIGGVLPTILNIDPDVQYDSWLTIGVTDGNVDGSVMTVGIDFSAWTERTGLTVTNGAVFTMDPELTVVDGDEYVIAQITIPNGRSADVVVNAQGKTNCIECNPDNRVWSQDNIVFHITPPTINNPMIIPKNCMTWFDGCNTCQVNNGQIGGCTRMMCFRMDTPYCTRFNSAAQSVGQLSGRATGIGQTVGH